MKIGSMEMELTLVRNAMSRIQQNVESSRRPVAEVGGSDWHHIISNRNSNSKRTNDSSLTQLIEEDDSSKLSLVGPQSLAHLPC